jgi:Flp pilus assembly protein TadD
LNTINKPLLLASLLLTLLSGCSVAPVHQPPAEKSDTPQADSAPVEDKSSQAATDDRAATEDEAKIAAPIQHKQNPAVIALLDDAQQSQQRGDLNAAQNTLQRAQRIAPRDPQVYYSLASTHLELQDFALAEQVALKGVSIVQGDTDQLRRFWSLIATIRSKAGDDDGARQAQEKADRY